MDSIPGFVSVFTPGGEVEFVNRQIRESFGKSLEEMKRWGSGGMTHHEDLPLVVERFAHAIATGDPFDFEVRARRFDGVYRWFRSRGLPLHEPTGTSSAGTTCSSTSTSASTPRKPWTRRGPTSRMWHG